MNFDYEDFRDVRKTAEYGAGNEPPYGFDAEVIRLFLSVWY
jgi:phage gp45-like